MKAEFWLQRWQNSEIGFHRDEVNPNLLEYIDALGLKTGDSVLVPLCGKSKDMVWLAQRGVNVVGVELSEIAIAAFFEENQLSVEKIATDVGECWRSGNITVYCADFFDIKAEHCRHIDAVYDRAALVALPEIMRAEYCRHLVEIVPEPLSLLLVSFDYDQVKMDGPPFSVPSDQIKRYFSGVVPIRPLASKDILAEETHFQDRGLDEILEQVYFMGYPSRVA